MNLAAKATQVYGGTLTENFDRLSQAIAMGQTRMLKNYGITVDATKAVNDFAKKNGFAADTISDFGKQQAILEQVLAQSEKRFKDINVDTESAITNWQRFKTSISEVGDAFLTLWNKTAGPIVRNIVKSLSDAAHETKVWVEALAGSDAQKASANVEKINLQLKELDKLKTGVWTSAGIGGATLVKLDEKTYEERKAALLKQRDELLKVKEETDKKINKDNAAGATPETKEAKQDHDKALAQEAKFQADILKLKQKETADAIKVNEDEATVDALIDRKKYQARQEAANYAAKINTDQTHYSEGQKKALIEANAKDLNNRLKEIENERQKDHEQAVNNLVNSEVTGFKAIEAAAQKTAKDGSKGFQTMGQQSAFAMQTMSGHMVNEFKKVGAGQESVAEAMKNIFIQTLADMAVKKGEVMIMESFEFWPAWPNPKTAGGLALVALGGALGAMTGGSGGSSIGGSSGGGGGGNDATSTAPTLDQTTAQKKTVTVNIAGNYIDTSDTRRLMLDMIRQETDATDFRYQSVRA